MQGALIPIPAILHRFPPPYYAHVPLNNDSVRRYVKNTTSRFQLEPELNEQIRNTDKNPIQFQVTENFTDEKNLQLPKNEKNSPKFKGIDQINESLGKWNVTDGKNKIFIKQPKFKEIETWNQWVEATTKNITYDSTSVLVNLTTTTDNVISDTTTDDVNPTTKPVDFNPTTKAVDVNPTTKAVDVNPTTKAVDVNPTTKAVDVNPTTTTENVNSNSGSGTVAPGMENWEEYLFLVYWVIITIAILVFGYVLRCVTRSWKKHAALNLKQKKTYDTETGNGKAQESENASLLNGNNPASTLSDGNNQDDEFQMVEITRL